METPSLRPGTTVWSEIHALVDEQFPLFNERSFGIGIATIGDGRVVFTYTVDSDDHGSGASVPQYDFVWKKMCFFVEALAITNFTNLWLDDTLWIDKLPVWTRPRVVDPVPEKESAPAESVYDATHTITLVAELGHHIATNFHQAWLYHRTGCYLLRNSVPGEAFHAEALLNFFKIGELITAKMYLKNPKLRDILAASDELDVTKHFSHQDVRSFYRVRCQDAAHDWLNARPVTREMTIDCKMWSEEMLVKHALLKGVRVVGGVAAIPSNPPKEGGPPVRNVAP